MKWGLIMIKRIKLYINNTLIFSLFKYIKTKRKFLKVFRHNSKRLELIKSKSTVQIKEIEEMINKCNLLIEFINIFDNTSIDFELVKKQDNELLSKLSPNAINTWEDLKNHYQSNILILEKIKGEVETVVNEVDDEHENLSNVLLDSKMVSKEIIKKSILFILSAFITVTILVIMLVSNKSMLFIILKTVASIIVCIKYLYMSVKNLIKIYNNQDNKIDKIKKIAFYMVLSILIQVLYLTYIIEIWGKSVTYMMYIMLTLIIIILTIKILDLLISTSKKSGELLKDKMSGHMVSLSIFSLIIFLVLLIGKEVTISKVFLDIFISLLGIISISYIINGLVNIDDFSKNKFSALKIILLIIFTIIIYVWSIKTWFGSETASYILTVSSGVIGGGLTLTGVAWTIKRQDSIRREEEKQRNKPYLRLQNDTNNIPTCNIKTKDFIGLSVKKLRDFENTKISDDTLCDFLGVKNFLIKNTDNACFIFEGISINNIYYPLTNSKLIEKSEIIYINLNNELVKFSSKIESFNIIIKDLQGIRYQVKTKIEFSYNSKVTDKDNQYLRAIYEIKDVFLPEEL